MATLVVRAHWDEIDGGVAARLGLCDPGFSMGDLKEEEQRTPGVAAAGAQMLATLDLVRPSLAAPPLDAALRLGVAALVAGGLALVFAGFGLSPWPGSEELLYAGDLKVSVVAVTAAFASLALGVIALCVAVLSQRRGQRIGLVGVALAAAGAGLTVLNGLTLVAREQGILLANNPSVDYGFQQIPRWVLCLPAGAVMIVAVVVCAPLPWLRRSPRLAGTLIALPIGAAFLAWAFSPHSGNELTQGLRAAVDSESFEIISSAPSAVALAAAAYLALLVMIGAIRVVVIFAAVEAARAQATVANLGKRLPARLGWSSLAVLRVAIAIKILFLTLGFAGAFGWAQQGQLWELGGPRAWLVALAFTGFGAFVFFSTRNQPLDTYGLRVLTGLVMVGLSFPVAPLLLAAVVRGTVGALLPGAWLEGFEQDATDAAVWLSRLAPLATMLAAGVLAAIWWRRRRRPCAGALLGFAYLIWGLPSAIGVALTSLDDPVAPSLSQPVLLDAVVTGVILVLIVRPRANGPLVHAELLVAILVASSLLAFGGWLLLPDPWGDALFVPLLLAPVAWRFIVDTDKELVRPPAHTVVSMVGWSFLLVASALALAWNFDRDTWATATRLQWKIMVAPLLLVLLAPMAATVAGPVAPGWRAGCTEHPAVESRGTRWVAVLAAAALVAGSTSLLIRAFTAGEAGRGIHRVNLVLSDAWAGTSGGCHSDLSELATMSLPGANGVVEGVIISGHGPRENLVALAEACSTDPQVQSQDEAALAGSWAEAIFPPMAKACPPSLPEAEDLSRPQAASFTFHPDEPGFACWHFAARGVDRFIVVVDVAPTAAGPRTVVLSGTAGVAFDGGTHGR